MANTIKFLTKNGLKTQNIDFSSPTEVNTIQVRMLDGGVLSFSGTSGQLFSISDSLTGTIFAVNDISGVPSIEVDDTGVIRFGQYSGNVLFGTAVDNGVDKVQVNGTVSAVSYSSTVATGTAPFTVSSTTKVTNLYADKAALADNSTLVGGYAPNAAVSNNTVVLRNATGYIFGNYFNMTANVSATAASHIAIQNSSDNYLRWQTPAQFIANHGLAALLSPALTGTPTAPTAVVNTNTTQLATTAFVNAEIANDAAPISHVGSGGTSHAAATTSVAGFMSAADKVKLNDIAAGATANTGTVTSVGGTGTVNGLTLTGTVTGAGNLTLGGTLSAISNSALTNSAITVGTTAISLGAASTTLTGLTSVTSTTFSGALNGNAATATNVAYSGLTGTVPTWNQSTTGNASTATKLATARTINGVSFDGSADITVADATKAPLTGTGASGTWGISITGNAATATNVAYTGLTGTVPTWNQNTTGNAATVTTITSGQVTGALGFTPYNATNPSGYTTNTGTVTSVGGTGTVSGLTLSGTVSTTGNLTLGGTLAVLPTNFASQTAQMALIAPSAANGVPTFRYIELADIIDAWTKKSVRAATTANITLSGAQTIDGVALVAGDRALVKNQTLAKDNGVYLVAAGAWTRTTDSNTSSRIAGGTVNVDSGTQGGFLYTTNFKTTDTLGTTDMTWTKVVDESMASTIVGAALGTAAIGTSTSYARADHVHAAPTTITGNAGTATILQTARTINGVSFNGSANITIADATKEPSIAAGTTAQYWRGDKSWQTLNKAAVGLTSVDDTSDVNKPVSTATTTALNLKANLASPTLTGVPAAPTAAVTTNTTQLATTAFVNAEIANDAAPIAHVGSGAGAHANVVAAGASGFMTGADKTKLDNIATGATANTGTVTSVGGTGTVNGLTLTGTVTSTGNLTLGGTLAVGATNFASQAANTVLAAPAGAAGVPTFRTIVAADVPVLNQNTTGNAGTATVLQTARTINGVSFNGSANITVADSTKAPLTGGGTSGTWGISITGNAATATNLATPRNINGIPFDGSANITISTGSPILDTTVISTNTTAVVYKSYVITASLILTLPASPVAGNWIDIQNSSGTVTITVARNSQNIMSLAEDMTIDINNSGFRLMFADATRGWVII